MKLSTQVITHLPQPRERVFDFATNVENLPRVYKGYGPTPGIARAWTEGDGATKSGAIRKLEMTDGSTLTEEVIELERPSKLYYRLTGFRPPLSFLLDAAEGLWLFSPAGSGTRIIWNFRAELASPVAIPVAYAAVKVFMHRAMKRCLNEITAQV